MRKVAVVGNGKVSRQSVLAQVEDLFDALPDSTRVVLPIMKTDTGSELAGNSARWVAEWAIDVGVPIEIAVTDNDHSVIVTKDMLTTDVIDASVKVNSGKSIPKAISNALDEGGMALVAWDDDDEMCHRVVALASGLGVKCLDLTSGLSELVWEEDEPNDEPGDPEPQDPNPVRRREQEDPESDDEGDEHNEWPNVYAEAQREIAQIFKQAARDAEAVLERHASRQQARQEKRERRKAHAE